MHVESGAVLHKQFDPNQWCRPLLWLQARLAHQRGPFGNLSGHIGRKLRRMLPSSREDLRLPRQEGSVPNLTAHLTQCPLLAMPCSKRKRYTITPSVSARNVGRAGYWTAPYVDAVGGAFEEGVTSAETVPGGVAVATGVSFLSCLLADLPTGLSSAWTGLGAN
jgi:hypothetical protein